MRQIFLKDDIALKWADVYFGVANVDVVVTLLTTSVSWGDAGLTGLEETHHPLTSLWVPSCHAVCHISYP